MRLEIKIALGSDFSMIFKDFGWVWEEFWMDLGRILAGFMFFFLKGLGGTNFWEPSFED